MKTLRTFSMAIAILPLTLSIAWSQHIHGYISGNELLRTCASSATIADQMRCLGYVAGVADYLETMRFLMGIRPCLPSTAELSQARDVLIAYIEQHPESRDQSGAALAISAFRQAWKCDKP